MKIVHSVSFFRANASGYESPRAGTSQGIFFKNFIKLLVYAHYAAFRGWELVIHHDDRVTAFEEFKFLDRCHNAGLLRLVYMGSVPSLCGGMLWRLLPIWNSDADVVVCRDVDSLPMDRDRVMVEEFSRSEAAVHAVLDSESHCGPLMGGMVSFKPSAMKDEFPGGLHEIIQESREDLDKHGADQRVLNQVVWPKLRRRTLIHQRRDDIQYPDATETRKVAPQVTALDKVVRHIGAAYPREMAWDILKGERAYELGSGIHPLEMLDSLKYPKSTPWYTAGAIEFVSNYVRPSTRIYESGGGGSSAWYSARSSDVTAKEHDPLWQTMIRSTSPDVKLNEEPTGEYDLIAIDGVDRINEVKRLSPFVKRGGYLLIDNSERYGDVGLGEWERKDYPENPEWHTSTWRRPL